MTAVESLYDLARIALAASDPSSKLAAIDCLDAACGAKPDAETGAVPSAGHLRPNGLPIPPRLSFAALSSDAGTADLVRGVFTSLLRVTPDKVPRRRPNTVAGRAALLHAIAHIEYSAIDLALDHALRFPGFPEQYYSDWLRVASEEARHFRLLREHLLSLGHDYGDFPVHDGLWDMAEKTATDPLARMAMVPRLLEARGLDATPPIQRKLAEAGDTAAVAILEVILHDEEDHVRLGDCWFRFLCTQRGLEPEATFRQLIVDYAGPWPQTPMNETARLAAGFSQQELDDLTAKRPGR